MNRMDACQSTFILGYAKYAKYFNKYAIKHAEKYAIKYVEYATTFMDMQNM
jgi:hypothetical protein